LQEERPAEPDVAGIEREVYLQPLLYPVSNHTYILNLDDFLQVLVSASTRRLETPTVFSIVSEYIDSLR